MARISLVHGRQAGWLTRLAYRLARRRYGQVPEPFQAAAHHRGLMWASGLHELLVERAARRLDEPLRELVVHRVATRVGCSWCMDFGTMLALRAGVALRHRELGRYASSPAFTDIEKLALAYADAMTDLPMSVTDAQVAALRERLGEAGLIELTYLIALENMRARTNHALGLTAQGYTTGEACPMPYDEQITAATDRPDGMDTVSVLASRTIARPMRSALHDEPA